MRALPAALAPGDRIWTPGGEAVVLGVQAHGPLVRVEYRDTVSTAVVYLRQTTPVLLRSPGDGVP